MPSRIDNLRDHIARLERELESEFNSVRDRWRYRIEAGRVRFDRDVQLARPPARAISNSSSPTGSTEGRPFTGRCLTWSGIVPRSSGSDQLDAQDRTR